MLPVTSSELSTEFAAILVLSIALSAMFPVAIVFAAISAVVTLPGTMQYPS